MVKHGRPIYIYKDTNIATKKQDLAANDIPHKNYNAHSRYCMYFLHGP